MDVVWTEYFRYRATLRGFDLDRIEEIVKHSSERYVDTATDRRIAVGRCGKTLVLVPYEASGDVVTPITIHATTRRQIAFRVQTGRFIHA
jgi:hypothetical protein